MCCRSYRSSWQACSMFHCSVLDVMTQYLYHDFHKSTSGKIPGFAVRPAGQSSQQRSHSSRPAARRTERQRKHIAAPATRCREAVTFCKRNRLFRHARPSCSRSAAICFCVGTEVAGRCDAVIPSHFIVATLSALEHCTEMLHPELCST